MKTGTVIKPHLHLACNAAIGATGYNVEVTTEHSWTNDNQVFPSPAVTATGLVASFQNSGQYMSKRLALGDITPTATQGGISSYVIYKVERIGASVQPISPADSVFVLGMDIHYEIDTLGSRTETTK